MPAMKTRTSPIYQHPVELLQDLIRYNTTNPPGNEAACIAYIADLLRQSDIPSSILGRSEQRTNVIARLKGSGQAAPLLLYGHVDVVTTQGQRWQHPPFEAEIQDGFVWGRGALDMKSGVAMMLAALLKAKADGVLLPGDVIFCAVADEEAGGHFGSRFLVDEHPDLFKDVRYALGEFGGFNMDLGGRSIYPIMVAEKQCCWMKITFTGRGGHGSMPVHQQAMAKLARAVDLLDRRGLPYHLTPPARLMIRSLAEAVGGLSGLVIHALASRPMAGLTLGLLGERGAIFSPLLHNTASPTMLQASDKINVIPSEVNLGLDGRLLPGFSPRDLEDELRALLGPDFSLEILEFDPGPSAPEMGLFSTLASVLQDLDPQGIPIPYMLSGVTDARFFSKLGIQTYGFTPLKLTKGFEFITSVHAADERVPVQALDFGMQAIYHALQRFH